MSAQDPREQLTERALTIEQAKTLLGVPMPPRWSFPRGAPGCHSSARA
ncbi:hypothetical protein QT383_05205 [Stenotrophomonas rhizophila]